MFFKERFQYCFYFNGLVPDNSVESAIRAAFKLSCFSRIVSNSEELLLLGFQLCII